MSIKNIISRPQHHAYLIFGYTPEELDAIQEKGVYSIHANTGIGVNEARELHGYAFQSSDAEERKIVVSAPSISLQAQNTLLKLMEEAEKGTYFFISLPRGIEIIATLLSRCYVFDRGVTDESGTSKYFTDLMSATVSGRLAIIEKIWKQEDERHIITLQLLQNIEKHLHEAIVKGEKEEEGSIMRYRQAAQSLRSALQKGALQKMTLQILAFI